MGDESLVPSQPGADTFLVRDAPACPAAKVNCRQTIVLYLFFVGLPPATTNDKWSLKGMKYRLS